MLETGTYLISYLLGAFPTGLLIAKIHKVDLLSQGSGNVGATNVARVIGKKYGIITLVADILKGLMTVVIASIFLKNSYSVGFCAFLAVAGHCFSIPYVLRGGKGVATAFGTFLGIYPLAALFALFSFAAVFLISKIVSLASVLAALSVPIFSYFIIGASPINFFLMLISLLVVFRHKDNIKRLLNGTEKKFSFKKS
ncbi:UNVERIFIED_CONTAM: hypothetical protein GTU68_025290 [Idotea baltica]|nr:hypothetical protein [Idotea baltica]